MCRPEEFVLGNELLSDNYDMRIADNEQAEINEIRYRT